MKKKVLSLMMAAMFIGSVNINSIVAFADEAAEESVA